MSGTLGLTLISHGSPMEDWNAEQMRLLQEVKDVIAKSSGSGLFKHINWAWLEFAQPDVLAACEELEAAAVSRIIAVPVFISTSSHSIRDIPNCLGTMWHPVSDENSDRRYLGSVPVTQTPCMDHGTVLVDVVSDNAKKVSEGMDMKTVGFVVASHGDGCEHFWGHLHERIRIAIGKKTGVEDALRVTIQTARKPAAQKNLVDAVREVEARGRTNIFVISCFNGTGGQTFVDRVQTRYLGEEPFCKNPETNLKGDDIWMRDPRVAKHVANLALNAARRHLGMEYEDLEAEEEHPPYNPPFYHTRDKGKPAEPEAPAKGKGKGKGDAKGGLGKEGSAGKGAATSKGDATAPKTEHPAGEGKGSGKEKGSAA